MKQLFSFLFVALAFTATAQVDLPDYKESKTSKTSSSKFGIKAGYSISMLAGSSPSLSPYNEDGFMAALFYAPSKKSGLGYRSELVFSRQGFGFNSNGAGSVVNDYIYLPQFTTFNITRFVQLQAGGQIGYLLKSSLGTKISTGSTEAATSINLTDLTNRLDYGAAFGLEIYPFKGLILGGRYNVSFGNTYKLSEPSGGIPSPLPFNPSELKGKNAVINFFAGYKF